MAMSSATVPAFARVVSGALRAMPDTLRGRTLLDRAWDGIRVLRVEAEPQDTPEGTLVNHVVLLNVGADASCDVSVEGGGWEAHHLPHHGVSVFPARVPYAARCAGAQDCLLVEIAPEFADGVLRPSAPEAGLRPIVGARDPFSTHVLLALAEEARSGAPAGGSVRAEGLAAALVANLGCREIEPSRAPFPELTSPRLRRVLDHVAGHLDAPLTLSALAELAQMDLFRFVRAFKQSTGTSPHRYVLEARIACAKELLRDQTISITEVALRTGFATPSHFSVTFRRMTSTTPRAYREAISSAPRPDGGARHP
jgi:AraC family transcriptional regulator